MQNTYHPGGDANTTANVVRPKFRIPGKSFRTPIPRVNLANEPDDTIINIDSTQQQPDIVVYHKKIKLDITKFIIWFNFISIFIILIIIFLKLPSYTSTTEILKTVEHVEPIKQRTVPMLEMDFTLTKLDESISVKLLDIDYKKIIVYNCCCTTEFIISCNIDLNIDTNEHKINISTSNNNLIGARCKFSWIY